MSEFIGPWIETASGKRFSLLHPHPDQIDIRDIAHALSMQCRYTGHTRKFASVAEHSYNVSTLVPPEDALWGLLHDGSEAYIGDISRPLKRLTDVGPPYLVIERRIMDAICDKFNLPHEMPESVHIADNAMLMAEKKHLMTPLSWTDDQSGGPRDKVADIVPQCWYPEMARAIFEDQYLRLTHQPYGFPRYSKPEELVVLP